MASPEAIEGVPTNPRPVMVRLSDAAAAEWPALLAGMANTEVRRGGAENAILSALYDDPRAPSIFAALTPGIDVSHAGGAPQLVARFRNPSQGGHLANPPPLTAIRLVTLTGLNPEQGAVIAKLFLALIAHSEGADVADPPALRPALEAARGVLDDPRARGSCPAPCTPWPFQTRWSLQLTHAYAAWLLGENAGDETLLKASEASARDAFGTLPVVGYPLTSAVSLRLLGAVSEALASRDAHPPMVQASVAATRRAAALFQQANQRQDWALTLLNLQAALLLQSEYEASARSLDDALQASDQALAVLPEDGSSLWLAAITRRVALLLEQWERTEDVAWLTQAKNLLERATPRAPNTPGQALAASSLCEISSAIVFDRRDAEEFARSVAGCERAMGPQSSSRSVEPTVRHQYAIALVRHGHTARNVETLRRGVALLAVDAADHDRSVRHRSTMASNYAWGLWLLATLENPSEHLRNASAVIDNAAWPGSREAAPIRWAQIRKLAGKVYLARGSLERAGFHMKPAAEYYRQAQHAFLDAQTVFTKREAASPWAKLEERIGDTLARLGEIEGSEALYTQSVQHYQRALSGQQQSVDPEAFARIQLGIGRAYLDWADQQRGLDRIRRKANRAVSAFRLALDAYRKLGVPKKIADTEQHLALAVAIVARVNRSPGCEALALTIHALETDPTASGPGESARASLARSDPANYGPAVCPSLDRDAWMKIRASEPPKRQ